HWLQLIRPHTNNPQTLTTFINSHSTNPSFQAFSYTASFHSRDLRMLESGGEYVDLGPYGAGEYLFGLDDLSENFVRDMEQNMAYFGENRGVWRWDLYERIRERERVIHSSLGRRKEDVAKVVMMEPAFPRGT
ncbi:MAG: hypothetical protein Q9172_007788, partial [Xanthocarpia lactea]